MSIVEKPWGTFETLDQSCNTWLKRIIVNPGSRLSLQSHEGRMEFWFCVSGRGVAQIGDKKEYLFPGIRTIIPTNFKHRLSNTYIEPLVIWELAYGYCDENDIIRYEDDYERQT